MSKETDDDGRLSRYLLGTSDQPEQAYIEERLLRDTTFYQELLIAEDELVDQYLANELSHEQRANFDKNFLVTPERWQKLRFARSLSRYITEAAGSRSVASLDPDSPEEYDPQAATQRSRPFLGFLSWQNPVARYALAAVVLLAFSTAVWFATKSIQNTTQTGHRVLAVTLTPGLTRGTGQTADIHLPKDVGGLQLRLALPSEEYQSYHAELIAEGRTVVIEEDLKAETANGKFLILSIDARALTAGDYQVKVSGRSPNQADERLQSYLFRILADDQAK